MANVLYVQMYSLIMLAMVTISALELITSLCYYLSYVPFGCGMYSDTYCACVSVCC